MLERTEGIHPKDLQGQLPLDLVDPDVDLASIKSTAIDLLKNLDREALTEGALWKDWLALTGKVKTIYGRDQILQLWRKETAQRGLDNFTTTSAHLTRPCDGTSWVSVGANFTSHRSDGLQVDCSATIGLVPGNDGKWRIWMFTTLLEQIKGQPDVDKAPTAVSHEQMYTPPGLDAAVVIVGGGQSGLSLAGRLRALKIKALVIEKGPHVGRAWTSKYDIVRQHTIREYNNLPFDRTWKEDDPDLLPGKTVQEGFDKYVERYGIEVWLNSEVIECTRDDAKDMWTIKVSQAEDTNSSSSSNTRSDSEDSTGSSTETRQITCRHLAMAIGAAVSVPKTPDIPNSRTFKGVAIHQSKFRNGQPYRNKNALIIGSGTTGHDIAQSLLDDGAASITMIQRKRTPIYPIEWICDSQRGLYNLSIPTDVGDRLGNTSPSQIGREIIRRIFVKRAEEPHFKKLFDDLEKAGFRVNREGDLMGQIYTKYGGYYIDVGTCKHVANGDIKVKSGVTAETFTENGVKFSDGSEVEADVVIYSTGYEWNYRQQCAEIVGEKVAAECEEFFGLDANGDVRGVMKEVRKGFWMFGITANQARWWSRFVGLLILSDLRGLNLELE